MRGKYSTWSFLHSPISHKWHLTLLLPKCHLQKNCMYGMFSMIMKQAFEWHVWLKFIYHFTSTHPESYHHFVFHSLALLKQTLIVMLRGAKPGLFLPPSPSNILNIKANRIKMIHLKNSLLHSYAHPILPIENNFFCLKSRLVCIPDKLMGVLLWGDAHRSQTWHHWSLCVNMYRKSFNNSLVIYPTPQGFFFLILSLTCIF